MSKDDRLLYLQNLSDATVARQLIERRRLQAATPAAHDAALDYAPGDRVVDSVTGELVEVIVGRRTQHVISAS